MNPRYANLDFKFNNTNLYVEDHGGYEKRHESTINLIREAWYSHIKNDLQPEPLRFFTLYTDDVFNPFAHFSFAIDNPMMTNRCMPNFIFDSWPSCGIQDYQETFKDMVVEGSKPCEFERAFWSGVVHHGCLSRSLGLSVSNKMPDKIEFRSIKWVREGSAQITQQFASNSVSYTPGYVTLPHHCKYRVLIDFGGFGFSARLPLLLASRRPVIIVGRPQESWFYWDGSLTPWEHYIPCGAKDGSDIDEDLIAGSLEWTFKNPKMAAEIGERGQKYALDNLTRSKALERIGHMMSGFCKEMW